MKAILFFSDLHQDWKNSVSETLTEQNVTDFKSVSELSDFRNLLKLLPSTWDGIVIFDDLAIQSASAQDFLMKAKYIAISQSPQTFVSETIPKSVQINIIAAHELSHSNQMGHKLFELALKNSLGTGLIKVEDLYTTDKKEIAFSLTNTKDKDIILEAIETEIQNHYSDLSPSMANFYAGRVGLVGDELILNSIFNANPRLAAADRSCVYELKKNEHVDVNLVLDKKYIGISVRDNFGSVDRANLFKHLSKLNVNEQMVDRKSGGMGLRLTLDSGTQLIINVQQNIVTEMTAIFQLLPSMKEYKKQIKTLLWAFQPIS